MAIKRSFYFIKHGKTVGDVEGILQGHTDSPLNDTGRNQAAKAAEAISELPIDIIVVSNLARAQETAKIINEKSQLPIIVDPRIAERNFGDWDGKLISELGVSQKKARAIKPEKIEKGGETYKQLINRVTESIDEHLTNNTNKNILFVSHGTVYTALHKDLLKNVKGSDAAKPYLFERNAHKWSLIRP